MLRKGWVLFLVVTVALGLAGGGYAAWTVRLQLLGAVSTGSVAAVWDQQQDREFVEVLDPATGELVAQPVPPDKDVADCVSDLEPGAAVRLVNFQVINAYPSYTCEITMGALVTGTVPVHISKIEATATDEADNDVLHSELSVDVDLTMKVADTASETGFRCDEDQPIGVSTQLHNGDRFCAIVRLHAQQEAKMNHTYSASVAMELIQWNLAGAPEIPPPTVVVDTSVTPAISGLPGFQADVLRPVASITDERGNQADFVENELILVTDDLAALDGFLARWEGELLSAIDPSEFGLTGESQHLVRINTSLADASSLSDDLRALDPLSRGAHQVSSDQGLRLLAAGASEAVSGRTVGVNFVGQGSDFRTRTTTEAPTGPPGYSPDTYNWVFLNEGSVQDIGVTEAWTALEKTGRLSNKVRIAILDGGFAPDGDFPAGWTAISNVPFTSPTGASNPGGCGSGNPCPWHGTKVVGAAMGVPGNGFGGAGPAGPVAQPVLVFTLYDFFTGVVAIAEASALGADIINMSYGAPVPASLSWSVIPFEVATLAARAGGILLFASAGNEGENVDATDCFIVCWEEAWYTPCENGGVICVGGLAQNSRNRAGFSNYGAEEVDIFAPGTVWVGPDPANPGNVAQQVSGTSFSSPYVAGVAALIWAADPSLSANQVESILFANAPGSPDPLVNQYVNAFDAVIDALGGNIPPDVSITFPGGGTSYSAGTLINLVAYATDPEDGIPNVSWTSSIDGLIGTGTPVSHAALSLGTHIITATATDSGGFSDSESITITIINDPPTVTIMQPANGASFFQGQTINLAGVSFDKNNPPAFTLTDAQVTWRLDGAPTPFDTGHTASIAGGTLNLGTHTISFTGTDGMLTDTDTITITILANPLDLPPDVLITSPSTGASFTADQFDSKGGMWFKAVTLVGQATDPEDGPLTGSSLVWTASIVSGEIQPIETLGTGETLNVKLFTPKEGLTAYLITLTATDGSGNKSTYKIVVTVGLIL